MINLQPNKQIENSLIVETTAYIQINCDGTWHTIGFGPDKKRIDNYLIRKGFNWEQINNVYADWGLI